MGDAAGNAPGNARGAAFMMLSMAGFAVNDALIKLSGAELELFQAIFLRGLFATGLIVALALWSGVLRPEIARRDKGLIALRVLAEVGATGCFLTALFNMPLANATAILQAAPLSVTLAAALFLGEPVGWRRSLAIAVGFTGVLLIVRPGSEGFTIFSLWALAAVGFVTLRDLVTNRLAKAVPSLFVAVCTSVAVTGLSGLGSLTAPWPSPSGDMIALLAAAAVFLLIGYIFGVKAMREGEIGYVSPFRYSVMIWALILGVLVFGERPSALTLIGAAIVAATGVYSLHRERILRRKLVTAPR